MVVTARSRAVVPLVVILILVSQVAHAQSVKDVLASAKNVNRGLSSFKVSIESTSVDLRKGAVAVQAAQPPKQEAVLWRSDGKTYAASAVKPGGGRRPVFTVDATRVLNRLNDYNTRLVKATDHAYEVELASKRQSQGKHLKMLLWISKKDSTVSRIQVTIGDRMVSDSTIAYEKLPQGFIVPKRAETLFPLVQKKTINERKNYQANIEIPKDVKARMK